MCGLGGSTGVAASASRMASLSCWSGTHTAKADGGHGHMRHEHCSPAYEPVLQRLLQRGRWHAQQLGLEWRPRTLNMHAFIHHPHAQRHVSMSAPPHAATINACERTEWCFEASPPRPRQRRRLGCRLCPLAAPAIAPRVQQLLPPPPPPAAPPACPVRPPAP